MALSIHKSDTGLVARETLCATRDGRVVAESDPEANSVIAVAGQRIPQKTAERYHLKATAAPGKAEKAEEPKPAAAEAKPAEEPKAETPAVTRRPLDTHGKAAK